ncbi:MAG: hypothetical protein AVDCRST_MAG42-716 [uncultured Chthoniobacterales bacterium]|uniref:Zinc-finger domain-containing protein n=1 Tax=uncultured Chthoniobacterales bacterium TaxID=1836801 RepID=A0A6J4HH77_9BACT|nr:MAG: hypothetical protein AVDCRST_MAG42-716 [uncultured Chthoniobacterales bacterium]
MTRDHLTSAEISAYAERRLDAAETLAASDHFAACDECRARLLQSGEAPGNAGAAVRSDEVTYDELAAWVDDELDPLRRREIAAAAESSPQLRAELADLIRFRSEMNALPARDHASEPMPARTRMPSFSRWALALAAALVVGGGAIWRATLPKPAAADFVKVRDGGRVIAFATDGRSPALAALPAAITAELAQTIRSGRIELTPEVAAMIGQTGTLAGPGETETEFRVLAPVGTAVREARPRFRWVAVPTASAYQINVVEETSGALILSEQLPPTTTEWEPPQPLPAGEVYQWQVQALRDGAVIANSPKPPEPEARFQILSEAKVAELEEARRASDGSHLVMGVANARAGLVDEALREFRLLSEQNPDAELTRQLLAQIEAQRRPRR